MASCTSPRVSFRTLPISRVMSRAYSSLRSIRISAARKTISARLGALGGVDGGIHVGLIRPLENGDHFARIGRVAVFESLAAHGFDPFAVNKVLENSGFSIAAIDHGLGQGIGR